MADSCKLIHICNYLFDCFQGLFNKTIYYKYLTGEWYFKLHCARVEPATLQANH